MVREALLLLFFSIVALREKEREDLEVVWRSE
jgi:hypothetical protein